MMQFVAAAGEVSAASILKLSALDWRVVTSMTAHGTGPLSDDRLRQEWRRLCVSLICYRRKN